ncbi:retrovirus-related pol polyprotein from transposon TNT 1-94 [Tanacetum coccineum]
MGYSDYHIRNVTIFRVYYIEGLRHNIFSVGQLCDLDLEVAFRKNTCFVRNLEGVDLLMGSRGTNLYTLSIGDMIKSSPICLLSKASKTKSWLWHRCLSHLNFGTINQLAKQGLVRGLPKLKFEKDHLCSALIVDDYSRFTWVKFLRSKDEALEFIIKFLKMIQVRLNATIKNIHTDNGTEFVNQTLRSYYEDVTVATACYTQNRSLISLRHGKTSYELLRDRKPDLSYLYVFGALCYPTNDSEDLGKLKAKADVGIFIGYAPVKKAYQIYNRRTKKIMETIHVDFDELTAMAVPDVSTGLLSSTLVDQDAPSPSTSQTPQESPSHVITHDAEEADHDIEVGHIDNNP